MDATVPGQAGLRLALMCAAVAALALALVPTTAAAAPSLTLTQSCDNYPPFSSIDIHLEGLPPNEPFRGTLEYFNDDGSFAGSVGPGDFSADEHGSFDFRFGSDRPQTYKATVEWAGGTLEATTRADCAPADGNDYAVRVSVTNPTWATDGRTKTRGFVVKVRNLDKGPFTVTADDVAAEVLVNGVAAGAVELVSTKVAKPGKRVKFRYAWTYGGVAAGDAVEYTGCVDATGDPDGDNDCDSYLTTAEEKP